VAKGGQEPVKQAALTRAKWVNRGDSRGRAERRFVDAARDETQ